VCSSSPFELFFRALSDAAAGIMRRGADRVYKDRILVGPMVSGRLTFGATLAVDRGMWRKAVSVQGWLASDCPQNAVIKTALWLAEACPELETLTRERARILALAFPGERCRTLAEARAALRQAHMHRNNSGYRRALFWAKLVLHATSPEGGELRLEKPLDERLLNRAFESFVRKSLESKLAGEAQVVKRRFHWSAGGRDPRGLVPIMETDATVLGRERCIVVDAKYYAEPLVTGPYGKTKLRSTHLYQVASYLRTLRRRDKLKRSWSACLVYAQNGDAFDYSFDLGDFRLHALGIDLEEDPPQILERVRSIWHS